MPRATRIGKETYQTAAVAYDEVTKAWFLHAGQACPVSSAPASIFKAAVLQIAPEHWGNAAAQELFKGKIHLDAVDRWFILDALAEKQCTLQLYKSREQAEQALSDQVQLDRSTATR